MPWPYVTFTAALESRTKRLGDFVTFPATHPCAAGSSGLCIPTQAFATCRSLEGNSHWYDLTKSQYLQGLLAQIDNEQRVYIVTIEPEMEDSRHAVWPRIVSEPKLALEPIR